MKNGFTLIELLAVIVILAIIAIIAVPIVLNIINDSKESSLLRSAEFYLDAVEYTIADAFLYHGGLDYDTTYQQNSIDNIYGYWTLSSYEDFYSIEACFVGNTGYVYSYSVDYDGGYGVRPVINLKL